MDELKSRIREVADFPKEGILFYDITTLLQSPEDFALVNERFAGLFADLEVDKVVGIESRGFIFGPVLAERKAAGFVPVRKPGKLPFETTVERYELEYGTDALEIHSDAVEPGERVLIVDDLVATGGTAHAASRLVERLGAEVAALGFVVELTFLGAREKLPDYRVESLIRY